MITNNEEKEFVSKQLNYVENALADLRKRLLPDNKKLYDIMGSGYINQIKELRKEINEYIGISEECPVENPEIVLRLFGPSIGYGSAPISIITSVLDEMRKGFQSIYSYISGYSYSRRPPRNVLENCDFSLFCIFEGSIQVALRRPNDQISIFDDNADEPFNKTADIFFKTANWAAKRESDKILNELIPDEELRDIALKSILRIIPKDSKRVNTVNFYGRLVKDNISLYDGAREYIVDNIIKREVDEVIYSYIGKIREIDLDKYSFKLREIKGETAISEITCSITEKFLEDIKASLDEFALVKGNIIEENKYSKKINVRYIEKYDIE